ncbi:hypothetical protein P9112_002628 [Eukaryota sp. TZLM1-RC]
MNAPQVKTIKVNCQKNLPTQSLATTKLEKLYKSLECHFGRLHHLVPVVIYLSLLCRPSFLFFINPAFQRPVHLSHSQPFEFLVLIHHPTISLLFSFMFRHHGIILIHFLTPKIQLIMFSGSQTTIRLS